MKKYIDFARTKDHTAPSNIVLSLDESDKSAEAIKTADRVSHIIITVLTYIFILALALVVIFPFYWMIITSLKQNEEIPSEIRSEWWYLLLL